MTTFVSPFTGTIVQPTDVSYYALTFASNQTLYWPTVVNDTQVPLARVMDCTASASSLSITLPAANQGTLGADVLIRNKGSNTFTVKDNTGGSVVSIAPGVCLYFYLTDNTTVAGVWQNITFGAATSSANAASLAGYGLTTTIAGQLATTGNIVQVSSSPTISDSSRAATFVWTSGAGNFTLPNTATLSAGWYISFRNSGTGALTITPTSPSTINGQTSIITNPGDSGTILYDSSTGKFFTVGWNVPANVTFSAATYDVDSISGSTYSLVSYAPIIQTYVALSGTRTTNLTVTLPNITQLYVLVNSTTSSSYSIIFTISGTSSTVTLPANTVVTIVADAGVIYPITQTSTANYFASNGSQTNPSFSFTSDIHTGMYLQGTSKLGLTANSILMLNIDNTNTSSPQISTPATLNAGLIPGGTF